MNIQIKSFTGTGVLQYLDDLSRLRMEVFRDFPYLYDSHIAYEKNYIRTLANAPNSIIVVVLDEDKVVGISTGMPMLDETPEVRQPFIENGYDISKVFYLGESVLQKAYRGKGIGVAFFKQREAHARSLQHFEWLTFCAVIRPENHPLRPKDYKPLPDFWHNRGFVPTDLICYMTWKDTNEAEEKPKPLRFWMKSL